MIIKRTWIPQSVKSKCAIKPQLFEMIFGANQWWMASERCPVCWRKTCSRDSGGELVGTVFIFVVIPVIVVSLSSITDIAIGIADQPLKFKLTQQFPPPSIFHWKVLLAEHDYLDSDLPVRNYIVLTTRSMRIFTCNINNSANWSWGWTSLRSSCMRTTTAAQLIKTLPFSKWPERSISQMFW